MGWVYILTRGGAFLDDARMLARILGLSLLVSIAVQATSFEVVTKQGLRTIRIPLANWREEVEALVALEAAALVDIHYGRSSGELISIGLSNGMHLDDLAHLRAYRVLVNRRPDSFSLHASLDPAFGQTALEAALEVLKVARPKFSKPTQDIFLMGPNPVDETIHRLPVFEGKLRADGRTFAVHATDQRLAEIALRSALAYHGLAIDVSEFIMVENPPTTCESPVVRPGLSNQSFNN